MYTSNLLQKKLSPTKSCHTKSKNNSEATTRASYGLLDSLENLVQDEINLLDQQITAELSKNQNINVLNMPPKILQRNKSVNRYFGDDQSNFEANVENFSNAVNSDSDSVM